MSELDDVLHRMMGLDNNKEIIDLWYEVTLLRCCVNNILRLNPEIHENFKEEDLKKCQEEAQEILKKKFPKFGLEFKPLKKEEESHDANH